MASTSRSRQDILGGFKVTHEQLRKVRDNMRQEVSASLRKNTREAGMMHMLPSYVRSLPDGTECGEFLALDLGGTNFRVLKVTLPREGVDAVVLSQVYRVPQNVMMGTSEELFDHIASCIRDFWETYELGHQSMPMGFTFSFPCVQTSLNKSKLLRWTKGFNAEGVVGNDPVELLNDALTRQRIKHGFKGNVNTVAIINDTVGTMMSCAYENPDCQIGLIVGTGTNACYMEKLDNMDEIDDPNHQICHNRKHRDMCVNTEWGCYGENGSLSSLLTAFDKKVDEQSINPKQMIYEKMISGMYMGEIVRYVLLHMSQEGLFFPGETSAKLQKQNGFPTSFLTQIEGDNTEDMKCSLQVLRHLGFPNNTIDDRLLLRNICQAVSQRAAHLCGAGVSALIDQMQDNWRKHRNPSEEERFKITVGVDGTVYKKHPTFARELAMKVAQLSPHSDISFKQSTDGSGKGAALVTAVTCRLMNQEELRNHGMP